MGTRRLWRRLDARGARSLQQQKAAPRRGQYKRITSLINLAILGKEGQQEGLAKVASMNVLQLLLLLLLLLLILILLSGKECSLFFEKSACIMGNNAPEAWT